MIRGEFPSIIKNHGKVGEIRGEMDLCQESGHTYKRNLLENDV